MTVERLDRLDSATEEQSPTKVGGSEKDMLEEFENEQKKIKSGNSDSPTKLFYGSNSKPSLMFDMKALEIVEEEG